MHLESVKGLDHKGLLYTTFSCISARGCYLLVTWQQLYPLLKNFPFREYKHVVHDEKFREMTKTSFTNTPSDESKTNAPSDRIEVFLEPAKKYKLMCLQKMALDEYGHNHIACCELIA